MIYGYARCSTNEKKQDIDRQVKELKREGAEVVYLEYTHGDSVVKKELETLLDKTVSGDTIITTEISRLARSTKQLCNIIDTVKNKKLCLKIIGSITIDCSNGTIDAMANAFCLMSGVFAELELNIIRERVKSGVRNAKEKGVKLGRPKLKADDIPDIFYKHYPAYLRKELNVSELSRVCKKTRKTIYKYIAIMGGN